MKAELGLTEIAMPKRLGGLSTTEAAERLKRYGPNILPEASRESLLRKFLEQFRSPLIYILLFALGFDLVAWGVESFEGLPLESLAIGGILLLNAGLGVTQEYRAEAALERLKQLATPQVWTLRGGELVQVPSPELVPGDVIRLEAGDRIPADGVVLDASSLSLDESVLTGESVPVDKGVGDDLLAGTLLTRGQGYAEVTRTGVKSSVGRLAHMLGALGTEKTPLEKRLSAFGNQIARWVVLLATLLVVVGVLVEGMGSFAEVFIFAVALAVAAVPEGLPAVLTSTLALGTERMARRKAVVRRLAAVEALGSVTVIATDKTGTLTENQMSVHTLDSPDQERALLAMVLANDADVNGGVGDPLELALLTYVRTQPLSPANLQQPRLGTRPFDAAWKFMRVTVGEDSERVSYFKGAPEVLLGLSTLDETKQKSWQEKLSAYAAEGYRTLALAWRHGDEEHDLSFLGLVLLWDPARPEVPEAVARAKDAGIRVLMMTGDHPATALAVADAVGIERGRVLVGSDVDALDEAELRQALSEVQVLARVTPEHKLRVVEALKAKGEVVAVTGDGVNDAPALKRSHIGVAMGQRGSDVAREVADLVLLDDNFATIVAAIEEGRSIFANIQKFLRFLFATNLAEVIVIVVGVAVALALGLRTADGNLLLPLTAVQILWINLVTDALPALALAIDKNPDTMTARPRDPAAQLLTRASVLFILASAGGLSLPVLLALGLLPQAGFSLEEARTVGFMTLVLGQLLITFSARRLNGASPRNPYLLLAVGGCVALQGVILFVPALNNLLNIVPLPVPLLALSVGGALLGWLLSEGVARLLKARVKG